MSRNNGGRGRGRGRGRRGGANRDRNPRQPAPPNWDDLGMFNASSDSDEDADLINGLVWMEALSHLRGGLSGKEHFGMGPDPNDSSNERIYHTEDGIPVNTIYASFTQAPESITEEVVRGMFEQFGPVKGVRIHTAQNNNQNDDNEEAATHRRRGRGRGAYRRQNRNAGIIRYGFISYERCEDAAKCLAKKALLKAQCYVAPADSWHQEAYQKAKETEQGEKRPNNGEVAGTSTVTGSTDGPSEASKAIAKVDLNSSVKSENANSSAELEPEGMNFLQLNDDCLLLICDYLELMDLLSLKKTCTRMEAITAETFKRYKILDFDIDPIEKKYLTLLDAKNILTELGPYVESLSISRDRFLKPGVRILNLIPRNCKNLKDLDIHDFTLNSKTLNAFDEVFKSLESLTLVACSLDDTVARNLKVAKKLQRLDLSQNSGITGKCLAQVSNLKHLDLEGCQNIQGKPFTIFAEKNKTLEYLNIASCSRLTTGAIKTIANSMTVLNHLVCNNHYESVEPATMALLARIPTLRQVQFKMNAYTPIDQMLEGFVEVNQLEHLDLSDGIFTSVNYDLLSRLTNLKELKMNYKLDFGDEHLAKLCGIGHFVELHIAGCTKITDKQLIEFIRKNPRLKLLDISYTQITEGLIFSAIDILKEQAVGCREGGRQLKMMVGQTSICQVILKNTLVEANRHLLNISFDSTEGFYSGIDADDMYDDIMDDDDDEDFMGYDYEDDDDVMWGLDHELDYEEVCQYFYDSDTDDYRYMYYM